MNVFQTDELLHTVAFAGNRVQRDKAYKTPIALRYLSTY